MVCKRGLARTSLPPLLQACCVWLYLLLLMDCAPAIFEGGIDCTTASVVLGDSSDSYFGGGSVQLLNIHRDCTALSACFLPTSASCITQAAHEEGDPPGSKGLPVLCCGLLGPLGASVGTSYLSSVGQHVAVRCRRKVHDGQRWVQRDGAVIEGLARVERITHVSHASRITALAIPGTMGE